MQLDRNIKNRFLTSVYYRPVTLLTGARQAGKSTFVKDLISKEHKAAYYTMDDITTYSSATTYPEDFLVSLPNQVILDEVQMVEALYRPLKATVDKDRIAGRFILTGSTSVMMLPKLAEALVGRMDIHTLWPLSMGEKNNHCESFIDAVFSDDFTPRNIHVAINDIIKEIVKGGYPEVVSLPEDIRQDWFSSYITAIINRDIKELSQIEGLHQFHNLLRLLAARAGGLLNFADISRSIGVANTTLKRYMSLLQAVLLTVYLPPWFANLEKRIVKSPKIYLNDTGILCFINRINEQRLRADLSLLGGVFENFVVMELTKQIGWSAERVNLSHFRTHAGLEVDIIMENTAGQIVAVEIKSKSNLSGQDMRPLKILQKEIGDRLIRGIILYTGEQVVPFGKNMIAVPIGNLWQL